MFKHIDTETHLIQVREAREKNWRRALFVGLDRKLMEFIGKTLDITWASKYNVFMRYDNTINLISRIKEVSNIFIISELEKIGMKGIVPSHGGIIVTLIEHKELTMTEIAEKINKDRSTVTTLVKKLNKIGVTETKKNENDQRSNFVFLTPEGRKLEEGFKKISERLYEIQFNGVTEEEKEIFRKILNKIYDNFKQENQN